MTGSADDPVAVADAVPSLQRAVIVSEQIAYWRARKIAPGVVMTEWFDQPPNPRQLARWSDVRKFMLNNWPQPLPAEPARRAA